MAIYPLQNIHTVNYPTVVSDEFEAGMALVLNASGIAVKADRSNILSTASSIVNVCSLEHTPQLLHIIFFFYQFF